MPPISMGGGIIKILSTRKFKICRLNWWMWQHDSRTGRCHW